MRVAAVGALGAPSSSCPSACHTEYKPVCGSNGATYNNACELGIASCQSLLQGRPRIYESYSGRCSPQLDDPIRCDMICDDQDVKTPICASDGVVYDNKCRFNLAYCAAFKNGHLLSIVSNSNTCPGPREPDCEKYAFNTTDPLGSSHPCSSTLQPICTTDGPFDNECDFCSFLDGMMDRWPNFKVAGHQIQYDGRCHDYFPGIQVGK
ncbi:uncharacterized protein [Haliotis cracherodii]|uniref:uncharacterized protein n=1 Tax=Haliotis cracherodii TaxID=6455 RepID=UPI0039ED7247